MTAPNTDPIAAFKEILRELVGRTGAASDATRLARLAEEAHISAEELRQAITSGQPLPKRETTKAIVTACLHHARPELAGQQLQNELAWWEEQRSAAARPPAPPQEIPVPSGEERSGSVASRDRGPWLARGREWVRHHRGPAVVVTALALVLVLVVAAVVVWLIRSADDTCAEAGLTLVDGECIGVTDGAFTGFDPVSADVVEQIATQNRLVSGDYLTVALLGPLSQPTQTGPPGGRPKEGQLSSDQMRQMLIGAAAAQHRVNSGRSFGDPRPAIRLLLANNGSFQNQWRAPVDRLISLAGAQDPRQRVAAVVALGTSVADTRDAAKALSGRQIPIIGAITTADELNYDNIPGMVRVTPATSTFVDHLSGYLDSHPELGPAIVVWDQNAETRGDLYAAALQKVFRDKLGRWIGQIPDQGFTGVTIPSDTWPQMFDGVTRNVCASGANTILFAGRVSDMGEFIDSLKERACRSRPLTIMTGVTALTAIHRNPDQLRQAGVQVIYAGVVHLDWPIGRGAPPEGWQLYTEALANAGYRADGTDAYTCLVHDATLTATRAIRLAATPNRMPGTSDVLGQLRNINGDYTIDGCSGSFEFTTTSNGAPLGTPVQIVTLPR
ncbi:type 1 periplasmic-binding domain-containing protein [Nocardia suismassiliense]|uniref:ABC transporter substrate-binding protein n=1 Tax=Nocardia suismassiliense TaxID=2077092 RepID=UPI000D1E7D1E|nr:ABC transporter substrate-binding protein [Nocardia suismassiliense]